MTLMTSFDVINCVFYMAHVKSIVLSDPLHGLLAEILPENWLALEIFTSDLQN